MKIRRTLMRIALLGYALAAATTAPPEVQAAVCPGSTSCRTTAQCRIYCGDSNPAHVCQLGCCLCAVPPRIE